MGVIGCGWKRRRVQWEEGTHIERAKGALKGNIELRDNASPHYALNYICGVTVEPCVFLGVHVFRWTKWDDEESVRRQFGGDLDDDGASGQRRSTTGGTRCRFELCLTGVEYLLPCVADCPTYPRWICWLQSMRGRDTKRLGAQSSNPASVTPANYARWKVGCGTFCKQNKDQV